MILEERVQQKEILEGLTLCGSSKRERSPSPLQLLSFFKYSDSFSRLSKSREHDLTPDGAAIIMTFSVIIRD